MTLLDRSINIVTVHASGSIRQLLNSELRALGYQNVVGVPDLASVLSLLETDIIHWLITPVLMEERLNVFQFLKLITQDPSMMDMRVSFLIDSSVDPFMVSQAFDLGLLSFHRNMATKTEVSNELKELFGLITDFPDTQSLVAAVYLRRHLMGQKRYDDLLRFEKSLFQQHAGHSHLLLRLAEAYLLCQQTELAKQLAAHALLIAPEMKEDMEQLLARYQSQLDVTASSASSPQDMLGIKTCLLVEPEAALRSKIEALLRQMGISEIKSFADGEPALQWLKSGAKPELVIFEWRLKNMPGPIFVQRLREKIGFGKPVTVMNKDLNEKDMPVLLEMGVTDRIKKPIVDQKFMKEVIWVIHQDRAPSEPIVILQKIRQAMADQDFEKLAAYTKRYMDNSKTSETDKTMLQAELAYFRGNYFHAKTFALQALKTGQSTVEILNLLGKSLMKLRDFEMALRCLENAEVMSPNNVRRICNMAEAELEQGRNEAYEDKINRAFDLDPDNEGVAEVKTKAALVHGDREKAKTLMHSLQSLLSIVSFTNNRAISLIRNDRFKDGTSLYMEAIQAVPEDDFEVQAVLHYNLGLALARMNRLSESRHHLDCAADLKSEKIHSKILSLKKRLIDAIDGQKPLELHAQQKHGHGEPAPRNPEADYDELMMALTIGPGDIGCHKIFFESARSSQIKELIDRPLRFKKRSRKAKTEPKAS